METINKNISIKELVISRTFNTGIEMLWNAWSNPEMFMKWWGPKGFTSPVCNNDFRKGGHYLWSMHSPEGKDYYNTGTFRDIVQNKKILLSQHFSDEKGNIIPASHYGLPGNWVSEVILKVTFDDKGGKTIMTINQSGIPEEMIEPSEMGWNQSLDKLAESLK